MKRSWIRLIRCGSWKKSLIVYSPSSTARQPCPSNLKCGFDWIPRIFGSRFDPGEGLHIKPGCFLFWEYWMRVVIVFFICLEFVEACDSCLLLIQSPCGEHRLW